MSTEQTLKKAAQLAKMGNKVGAAALYREVLAKFPGNLVAQYGLRSLGPVAPGPRPGPLPRPGAKGPGPKVPPKAEMDKLVRLLQTGQHPTVVQDGKRLVQVFPGAFPIYNMIGIAQMSLGEFDEAIEAFDKAVELFPKFVAAAANKAAALTAAKRFDEALEAAKRAHKIDPTNVEALSTLGFAELDLKHTKDARTRFEKVLKKSPTFGRALLGLGRVQASETDPACLATYRKAIAHAPSDPNVLMSLADALERVNMWDEAEDVLSKALKLSPQSPHLYSKMGLLLQAGAQNERALPFLQKAVELAPDGLEPKLMLAQGLTYIGRIDEAKALSQELYKAHPGNLDVINSYIPNRAGEATEADLKLLEAAAQDKDKPQEAQASYNFTLAEAYHRRKDYDQAFGFYDRGNRVVRENLKFDLEKDRDNFRTLMDSFNDLPAPVMPENPAAPTPIFVVGMPRSGTTLTETIIGRHSQVAMAGETAIATLALRWRGLAKSFGRPTPDDLAFIRDYYLNGITHWSGDAPYVTDKMPLNFRWVGYILSAIPEARIVHTMRDARAVCWSIFTKYFTGRGNNFAYGLEDVANYFLLYRELMDFWNQAFPGRIYNLNYELLTENQEEETHKLIDAVGLPWEDACLEFHKSDRAVLTASTHQVRQKMYTGSSEAWRKYEAHLGPMLDILKDV